MNKPNKVLLFFMAILFLIIGAFVGFAGVYTYQVLSLKSDVFISGDLSFHFLELGNESTGDCTLVKAGNTEVLIDAGSKTSSVPTITKYLNNYVTDNTLEYVIVTHAHEDHYAGFATGENTDSIFDLYNIGTVIDFAQTTESKPNQNMYKDYQRELTEAVNKGAKHFTALQCAKETDGAKSVFNLTDNITMTVLYQKFYEEVSSTENNHSVCTLFTQGSNNFLFTGDLEEEGEKSLAESNQLPHCVLYKAGHHGSKTSSHDVLLSEITPEICCVCCCAGNVEYLTRPPQNLSNSFPTQDFINRISEYTSKVYVTTLGYIKYDENAGKYVNNGFTSMNGNIVVTSSKKGVEVNCSNNNILLKDTQWFKENRTCPQKWVA